MTTKAYKRPTRLFAVSKTSLGKPINRLRKTGEWRSPLMDNVTHLKVGRFVSGNTQRALAKSLADSRFPQTAGAL